MALRNIARFADLTEAQVAASALEASGIEVLLADEVQGRNMPFLGQALGGYGLWVDETDERDATTLVEAGRATPREPIERTKARPPLWLALLAGLFGFSVSG